MKTNNRKITHPLGLIILICTFLLVPQLGRATGIDGVYINTHKGISSKITLTTKGNQLIVHLIGGHVGEAPLETASNDCEIEAHGFLENKRIVAKHVLVNGFEAEEDLYVVIQLENDKIRVLRTHAALAGCGTNTSFLGIYSKVTEQ